MDITWEQRKFSDIATRESSVCTSASDTPSVEYEDVVAEEGRLNKDIRSKEVVKTGIKVHPHMLRHGFAQEKLEAGWQLEQIQAYLRHKNPTSTEIYAQFTDALKISKMQEFEEVYDYTREAKLLGRHD